MKLGAVLLRTVVVIAIAAGAAQWWLVRESHAAAKRVAARLIPYGALRYDKLWPNLWGSGHVWGLSFEPGGLAALSLQTPPGFRLQARELKIHDLSLAADGSLSSIRGSLLGLEIPVAERKAPSSEAQDPADVPLPTLHDLGYASLRLDVDFSLRYVRDPDVAMVQINADGADLGRFFLRGELGGTPETFNRAPDQILLHDIQFEYLDAGLLTRFKDLAAARARNTRATWEQAMANRLERLRRSGQWEWDEDSAQAMRQAIRESRYLHAAIEPPSDVLLRNIRLYPVGQWPRLLGFSLRTDGGFEHPPTGRALEWDSGPR